MSASLLITGHIHLRVAKREQARFRAAAAVLRLGQSLIIRKLMTAFCDCIKERRDPGLQFRLASASAGRHPVAQRQRASRRCAK